VRCKVAEGKEDGLFLVDVNVLVYAFFAALAIETGCEWITTDRGFSRFPGLRWRQRLAITNTAATRSRNCRPAAKWLFAIMERGRLGRIWQVEYPCSGVFHNHEKPFRKAG